MSDASQTIPSLYLHEDVPIYQELFSRLQGENGENVELIMSRPKWDFTEAMSRFDRASEFDVDTAIARILKDDKQSDV